VKNTDVSMKNTDVGRVVFHQLLVVKKTFRVRDGGTNVVRTKVKVAYFSTFVHLTNEFDSFLTKKVANFKK